MDMSIKRRALLGGVILTLILILVTECKNLQVGTRESNQDRIESKNNEEEIKNYKLFINVGISREDGLDQWIEKYKQNTGIDLEIYQFSTNDYHQQLDLAFALGEAPDVFLLPSNKLPIYVSQEMLMNVTDMVTDSEILKNLDQEFLNSIKIDGKLYGVPIEKSTGTVTYMRQDWLDLVGKDIPTNYKEFIEVLREFKRMDESIIPFTAPGLGAGYLNEFYQDASPDFVKVDGKWVDGMTEPNMVSALERLTSAYAEGLLDVEIITNTTSTCRQKWYAGQVGAFSYWAGNWNVSLEDRLRKREPEASVVAIPPIAEGSYSKRVPAIAVISSTAVDPETIFKYFIEYMNDGEEGSMLFQHGVEGVHWEREDGQIVHLPKLSNPTEIVEKALISPVVSLTEITIPESQYTVDKRVYSSMQLLEDYAVDIEQRPYSKQLAKVELDLIALREKVLAYIITGQISVEEGIEAYRIESRNFGMDQVLKELNAY